MKKYSLLVLLTLSLFIGSCVKPRATPLSEVEIDSLEKAVSKDHSFESLKGFARIRLSEKGRSLGLRANIAIKLPDQFYGEILKSLQPLFYLSIQGSKMSILDPRKSVVYEGVTREELNRISLVEIDLENWILSFAGEWAIGDAEILRAKKRANQRIWRPKDSWKEVEVILDGSEDRPKELIFHRESSQVRFRRLDLLQNLLAKEIRFMDERTSLEVFWKEREIDPEISSEAFVLPEGPWKRLPMSALDGLPGL